MTFLSKFKELSGRIRIAVFVSFVWLIFIFAVSYDVRSRYRGLNLEQFLVFGVGPLVLFWGVWWIREGFKNR